MKITAVMGPVVVFDEKMYVRPFGTVVRWMDRVVLAFGNNARKYAPVQTGNLRAGIRTDVKNVGPRQLEGIIESTAHYSLWVLRGTTGPIMANRAWNLTHGDPDKFFMLFTRRTKANNFRPRPKRGMMLRFTSTETGTPVVTASVRGQEANNFLLEAWAATARTHRSLRGITIPVAIASP